MDWKKGPVVLLVVARVMLVVERVVWMVMLWMVT